MAFNFLYLQISRLYQLTPRLLLFAFLYFFTGTLQAVDTPTHGKGWPKLEKKVDNLVKDVMKKHHLTGMTVAVTKNGRLILSKGYGYARADVLPNGGFAFAPMTEDMRTRIGSVSKAVITGPTAFKLLKDLNINPNKTKLYGDDGIFGHRFDSDIQVNVRRFYPILATAISPDDKVYTWYVNQRYSVGNSLDLDRFEKNAQYLNTFSFALLPGKKDKWYLETDIRAIAMANDGKVYVWYNDGRRSVGTPDDLDKYKKPKNDEKVKLPDGQKMWNIVGVAIAKSNNHVYVWYDDGTLSSGTSLDFTKYFTGKKYKTPLKAIGTMSPYDIRGIGISSNDRVYVWYGNRMMSIGTSSQFDRYRQPLFYTIPQKIREYDGDFFKDRKLWWQSITIQNLFDHRSGFQRSGDVEGTMKMFGLPEKQLSYEQVHKHFIRTRPLKWWPGYNVLNKKIFTSYSNHGFGLFTLIISTLSGKSYEESVNQTLLNPLQLKGKVRPIKAKLDGLDAQPYNSKAGKIIKVELKDAGLGLAAGGWTAAAKSLLWITRYLITEFTVDQLDSMGWFKGMTGSLTHNGTISGGLAYVAIFPNGYVSAKTKEDLSNIHVAVATNTRPININKNHKDQDKTQNALNGLVANIALAVPKSEVPANYNIWGGMPELTKVAIPEQLYQYSFEHGYRPVWIDAYTVKNRVYFNLILRPSNGIPWVARHGLTSGQYQSEVTKWQKKGFRLKQVESYVANNKIRYAAIFTKEPGPEWTAYHGKSVQEHQQLFNALTAKGFRPINISLTSLNGKIKIAALYEKKNIGSYVALSSVPLDEYQKRFDENKSAGRQLVYLNAWQHNNQTYFSSIWSSLPKGAYKASHNITKNLFNQNRAKLIKKGYLTQFVSGYVGKYGHQFATLWLKWTAKKAKPIKTFSGD